MVTQPQASRTMPLSFPIAVINAGSSSLKFAVFVGTRRRLRGLIDGLGNAGRAVVRDAQGSMVHEEDLAAADHADALAWLFACLDRLDVRPRAVGHRVVHGGAELVEPVLVDADAVARIEALISLAPLHQPHNLAAIRAIAARFPGLPQIACFDTAFHASLPPLERLFALPRDYAERGLRRYGFHGLSYEYIASRLPALDPEAARGRTIVCHLGNGASLCAMHGGRSVATTMGFTALDGLPMGTRCGALDPGVLLHLLEYEGLSPAQLQDLLYRRSGLLGLSGVSSDMRDLLASSDPRAAEAVDYFCHRVARELGSLTAALGGLDALVFTGGIGEHAAPVRARICERSRWLGVELDADANTVNAERLHAPAGKVAIYRIATDEEAVIVRHVDRLLSSSADASSSQA
jgi:acetate kinase